MWLSCGDDWIWISNTNQEGISNCMWCILAPHQDLCYHCCVPGTPTVLQHGIAVITVSICISLLPPSARSGVICWNLQCYILQSAVHTVLEQQYNGSTVHDSRRHLNRTSWSPSWGSTFRQSTHQNGRNFPQGNHHNRLVVAPFKLLHFYETNLSRGSALHRPNGTRFLCKHPLKLDFNLLHEKISRTYFPFLSDETSIHDEVHRRCRFLGRLCRRLLPSLRHSFF